MAACINHTRLHFEAKHPQDKSNEAPLSSRRPVEVENAAQTTLTYRSLATRQSDI